VNLPTIRCQFCTGTYAQFARCPTCSAPAFSTALSDLQVDAVNYMRREGGVLERRAGGHWMKPGIPLQHADTPANRQARHWFFGALTMQALERHGIVAGDGSRFELTQDWKA
jgi:hypothetical protein